MALSAGEEQSWIWGRLTSSTTAVYVKSATSFGQIRSQMKNFRRRPAACICPLAKMACSRAKDGQWKATQSCIEMETEWEKKERQSKEHLVKDSDGAGGDGVFPGTKHKRRCMIVALCPNQDEEEISKKRKININKRRFKMRERGTNTQMERRSCS